MAIETEGGTYINVNGNEEKEITIKLKINDSAEERIKRYFKLRNISELSEGIKECEVLAYDDEFLYNVLLSFGDKITVIEPLKIKENLIEVVNSIKNNYK